MTVFLRWGIFGLLAVAALLYAYNASKRMSTRRQSMPAAATQPEASKTQTDFNAWSEEEAPEDAVPAVDEMSVRCRQEYLVAQRALIARRDSEPLDRVLRSEHVAFEEDASRRRRLENLAREWFDRGQPDPDDPELRSLILKRCR